MIRQAVIIAAGKGTRMAKDPTLKNTPKPLLEVKGRPMIEYKLENLAKNGVSICIVINPAFEHMFKDKLSGYDITYCYQRDQLGTASAVYASKPFVTDELFLVMMGDDMVEYDPRQLLKVREPTMFGFDVRDVTGYGVLVADENGDVDRIREKELSGPGTVNTGLYALPKSFFDYYSELGRNRQGEIGLDMVPTTLAKHGIKFKLRKIDDWFGINTPNDLSRANR